MLVQLINKDNYPHIINTDHVVNAYPNSGELNSTIEYAIDLLNDKCAYITFKDQQQATEQLQKLFLPC